MESRYLNSKNQQHLESFYDGGGPNICNKSFRIVYCELFFYLNVFNSKFLAIY
jgi:hypothetical protein